MSMALTPRLHVDDALYEYYEELAIERGHTLEETLQYRLIRGQDIDPMKRYLVLTEKDLATLEDILGGGQVIASGDLIRKVDRLAKLEFGTHKIPLSIGQLEEISRRARKNGQSITEAIEALWKRIAQEFFRYT